MGNCCKLSNIRKAGNRSVAKFSFHDQMVFFYQLATLTKAGVPLVYALKSVTSSTSSESDFKEHPLANILAKELINGNSLSYALSKFPNFFAAHIIAMVHVGEEGGTLHKMLERIAKSYEAKDRLSRSIKASLFYPAMVLLFSVLILIGLCQFVLPVFIEIFTAQNIPLPPVTQFFLKMLSFSTSRWFLVFLIVMFVFTVGWFKIYIKIPENRKQFEYLLWKIPGLNRLMAVIGALQFCHILSNLVGGGLGIIKSLKLTSKTLYSLVLQEEVDEIIHLITNGSSISEALMQNERFPRLVGTMLMVAEKTGSFAPALQKGTSYFILEVETAMETIQSLITPIVLGILGILVAVFILIFFVPIYTALGVT